MTDLTRGEFDSSLSAAEARTETRFIELRAEISRVADGLQAVRGDFTTLRTEVRDELREVKADNKNTRWTIAITVVTAVLAGAAAIWTAQNNLLAAFQAGLAERSVISSSAAAPLAAAPTRAAPVAPSPAARAR